jgi:hypothetical protein
MSLDQIPIVSTEPNVPNWLYKGVRVGNPSTPISNIAPNTFSIGELLPRPVLSSTKLYKSVSSIMIVPDKPSPLILIT